MGQNRKSRGGRAGDPTKRKRKADRDDAKTTVKENLPNSDIIETPKFDVDDIVKVEKGSELESSVDLDEAEITGHDPKPGKGLHAIASSSKSSKCKLTTTECENLDVTGERGNNNNEGKGNSGQSSHSCYWKGKSEELEKKTWELETDLAYWKGKAKELERNFLEVEAEPIIALRGSQSAASSCPITTTTVQSTLSSETSEKSDFTCPVPPVDESSNKNKIGRRNGNNRLRISKADRKMEVGEIHSVELNSNSSQMIGRGEGNTSGEKSPSRLCSATSPESDMTSRDPKRRVLRATAAGSKSYKLKVAESGNLAPSRRLFNNEMTGTLIVNPLLDEYIMEHVLQYVMRQPDKKDVLVDIKNFRQVCKPWRNAATRLYRKTAPVLKFGSYVERFGQYTFGKLKEFLETVKDSEMIPFKSYEIKGSINTFENQKLLEDFLRICGPEMVSVDFRFKKSGTFQGNFGLNGSPELELSKLKTVLVQVDDDNRVYNTSEAHAPVYFTVFVLNATRSLCEFKLKFKLSKLNPRGILELNPSSMKKFEDIICRAIPKSVKALDLQMVLTDRIFTCLAKKGLSLEEFAVDPSQVTGASEAIHCFMKNQSPHLKVLKIVGSRRKNNNLILEFPRLAKLETLKLADISVKPFSIAEKFPNLICLDVVPWEASKTFSKFLECAKETVPPAKKINLPLYFAATKPFAKQISDYFPNITELRLHCDFGNFSEVFTHLRNLEVLHISVTPSWTSAIDLDAGLSGISEEACMLVRKARKFDGVSLARFRIGPSMLNMTRLRKLVLEKWESKSNHKPVKLTDFSIHFIFLELAGLEELRISGFSTKSMVRQVYLERLKAGLHLTWESE